MVTSSRFALDCSVLPPPPELSSKLHWPVYPHLDTLSTFFCLKMPVFIIYLKCSVRQLNCPHQASLELWWRTVAANREQNPLSMYILRAVQRLGKQQCLYFAFVMYLSAVYLAFTNIKIIHQTKSCTLDL